MKMKRTALLKLMTGILVSCTVMLCGTSVFADIIAAPPHNTRFYELYHDECEHENRERGYSALTDFNTYMSPLSDQVVRHINKGDVLHSNTFYTDSEGVRWAYDYNWDWDDVTKAGWYKTENAILIYDSISFEEEHRDEFVYNKGQLNDYTPEKQVVFWTYPGSGEIDFIVSKEEWIPKKGYVDITDKTYADENGDEWLYIARGFRSWVNLSDIEGENAAEMQGERIYVTTEAIEEAYEPALAVSNIPISDRDEKSDFLLPIILALCAAAAAGGFLLGIMAEKKNKKARTNE